MNNIGDHIKELRESSGWSQRQLAAKADISNSTLSLYESNERTPSITALLKLSKALHADFGTMINMLEGTKDNTYVYRDFNKIAGVVAIPIVGTVRAGRPIMAIDNIEGYINIDRMMLSNNKEYYGLKITGDSMDKIIAIGSIVILEKTEDVKDGDIAVIGVNDQEATIKKIQFKNNKVILYPMSNNPIYEPLFYDEDDDIKILGKLIMSINQF